MFFNCIRMGKLTVCLCPWTKEVLYVNAVNVQFYCVNATVNTCKRLVNSVYTC